MSFLENSRIRNAPEDNHFDAVRAFTFVGFASDAPDFGVLVTRDPNPIAIAVSFG
jgi:hypothetical protein